MRTFARASKGLRRGFPFEAACWKALLCELMSGYLPPLPPWVAWCPSQGSMVCPLRSMAPTTVMGAGLAARPLFHLVPYWDHTAIVAPTPTPSPTPSSWWGAFLHPHLVQRPSDLHLAARLTWPFVPHFQPRSIQRWRCARSVPCSQRPKLSLLSGNHVSQEASGIAWSRL